MTFRFTLMCEVLGSHHFHLYNKKKLNQLKLNDLSWTHQRNVFAEKTGSHKSVEIGASREYLPEICLPAAEANELDAVNNAEAAEFASNCAPAAKLIDP